MAKSDQLQLDREPELWQLVKWEGDPPEPGEPKEPIEIIEGGRDHATRVTFRRSGADPASYAKGIPMGESLMNAKEKNDAHEN